MMLGNRNTQFGVRGICNNDLNGWPFTVDFVYIGGAFFVFWLCESSVRLSALRDFLWLMSLPTIQLQLVKMVQRTKPVEHFSRSPCYAKSECFPPSRCSETSSLVPCRDKRKKHHCPCLDTSKLDCRRRNRLLTKLRKVPMLSMKMQQTFWYNLIATGSRWIWRRSCQHWLAKGQKSVVSMPSTDVLTQQDAA